MPEETPAPGVGPSTHLTGQPVPLVVFQPVLRPHAPEAAWRWRCRYVDGLNGQHSTWHASVDDTGWAPTYAEVFDAGLRHVMLHLTLGRRPGILERARLQLRAHLTTRRTARRANRKDRP